MICPVRCFTCGRVLADKINYFQRQREQLLGSAKAAPVLQTGQTGEEQALGRVLDALDLTLMCCRRHMLAQVDLDGMI